MSFAEDVVRKGDEAFPNKKIVGFFALFCVFLLKPSVEQNDVQRMDNKRRAVKDVSGGYSEGKQQEKRGCGEGGSEEMGQVRD